MIYAANYASCEDADCMRDDSKNVDADQLAWPNVAGLYADLEKAKASVLEAFVDENSDMLEPTEDQMDDDSLPKWETSDWAVEDLQGYGGPRSHTCVVSYHGDVVGVCVVREMEIVK